MSCVFKSKGLGYCLKARGDTMRTRSIHFLFAAATLTAAGCVTGDATPPKTPTAVRVRAVERATSRSATRYSANINPASRVDLAFKVGGYVQRLANVRGVDGKSRVVQEGDHVSTGQVLAEVRVADYSQKLAESKAGLAEAVAAR